MISWNDKVHYPAEEIQFLSLFFLFLAIFKISRVRFRLFVAGNVYTVFLPIFSFLVIFVLLMLVLPVLFLVTVISLRLHFFYVVFESLYPYFNDMFNAGESPCSFFFLTHSLSTSSLVSKAECIVISFCSSQGRLL